MPSIQLNSLRYFFQSHGTHASSNPALVFLHGSGGDSSIWSRQLASLSSNHHIIAPDLPGHGQSQGSAVCELEIYANWLMQLTEALQVQPFVLAGHSLGGIIAQQFARMFPRSLRDLILVGTGMRFDIPDGYLDILDQDFESACEISGKQAYAAQMPADLLKQGINMLRRNGPATLKQDLQLCADFDSTQWAHSISIPCLIMCGMQDAIAPCPYSKQLAENISGSRLEYIDSAGHMVMQEQPDAFNRNVSLFIQNKCS